MKKYLLSIFIFFMICNSAFAVYTDNYSLFFLLHCDETNHPNSWLLTLDDNSSGREAKQAVLDRSATNGWTVDASTIPTLSPGSPKGGNYFHFNGTNNIVVNDGWNPGANNVICDFSLRWLGHPYNATDTFVALVQAKSWRSYLRPSGSNYCNVDFLISTDEGDVWLKSTKELTSNVWYDVHFSLNDGNATLIIDDITNVLSSINFVDKLSHISIGSDIYRLGNGGDKPQRFFYGDIDEVRVGTPPVPPPYYSDSRMLQLLMHCDITNHPNSWLLSPDDNSSGRDANQPVLDKALKTWTTNEATVPLLVTNYLRGGNYLEFDGEDDTVYVSPGWSNTTDLICDFSFKYLDYPKEEDPYMALVQTVAWRFFLRPGGPTTCKVAFYYRNSETGTETSLFSDKYLSFDKWYDVHFSLIDGQAMLIVDDTTNTAAITLTNISSHITIGNDIYRAGDSNPTNDRFFCGGIDEVRIGTIPEPFLISALLLFIGFGLLKRKS